MSVMAKNGLRLGSLVKYVIETPKFDSQYSRYIGHMSTQLSDQNAIKLIQSSNICKFGSVKFQHTQAGEKSANNTMSDSAKPLSSDSTSDASEKTEANHKSFCSWLDGYKFKTTFYPYGVRVDYETPNVIGWKNLQLATVLIDGEPTYKKGIPIHPDIIKALNEKAKRSWFEGYKFNVKFFKYGVKVVFGIPGHQLEYTREYEFHFDDDQAATKDSSLPTPIASGVHYECTMKSRRAWTNRACTVYS